MTEAAFADAIVVAAGESRRMDGLDKLAADVGGRPLLAWTLEAIAASPRVARIVVVATSARVEAIRDAAWLPGKVLAVTPGGTRRQESVAAGLAALDRLPGDAAPDDRVILVHDGARPLVPVSLVSAVADAAAAHGAAIPVVSVAETLKRVEDGVVVATVDRQRMAVAQTPQGVRRGLLREAFAAHPADGAEAFTDEAALLEACRIAVHAIRGDPSNLKVTLPGDLRRVESALAGTRSSRVGLGSDRHPFGPGRPLAIGGIEIQGAPRLHGHSDGDVALHAVADALLGAAALGDLGRVFPADARTPRGIASGELVRDIVGRVARAGFRPVSVDLVIVGARPRLGDRLDEIGERVASLLGLPAAAVNVKASTGNLEGMEGAGRGISAQAIALLESIR
ncbi:MAG: 2-C-methyl-D-erythritol 2,4-cyclodiphosphate synthase [Chloroflexi bacterium]|nr:MAG: 2-C-methyl-D-erythritol 2,4-cyclodiphosphate synthase [Chloroflexota bacterium]